MKSNPTLRVLSAASIGFLIGVTFAVQITSKLSPLNLVRDINCNTSGKNIFARFSTPFRNGTSKYTAEGTPLLQSNVTSDSEVQTLNLSEIKPTPVKIDLPEKPKGAERLPPNIVVRESDLHLRRLWGNPRQDTPTRKYLVALTVGYSERVNVNATVQKFSDNFDVLLFHYDGRTTEWDEFEWSKQAIHVSAREQAKWWYAKRFMHPSIVAPYDYIFLWDEDLGVETFDAEEYIKIVKKHGLEISQPGLDSTRGAKYFEITVRRDDTEIHTSTSAGRCRTSAHRRPCTEFVESMAPVFTRAAWACVWHMIQNDLVHGWGLDWHFWRCVDEPQQQIGVVDVQYVAHRNRLTLGKKVSMELDGSRYKVRARSKVEQGMLRARFDSAVRAQAAALLAQSDAAASATVIADH